MPKEIEPKENVNKLVLQENKEFIKQFNKKIPEEAFVKQRDNHYSKINKCVRERINLKKMLKYKEALKEKTIKRKQVTSSNHPPVLSDKNRQESEEKLIIDNKVEELETVQ